MGLTKRRDGYYVEFRVVDDGKTLSLASGIHGAKFKRWKVGSLNKTVAKQQEVLIKTDLMKGIIKSDNDKPMTFGEWAEIYLGLEEIQRLRSCKDRVNVVRLQLMPYFGRKYLTAITPEGVESYRAQRKNGMGRRSVCRRSITTHKKGIFKDLYGVMARKSLVFVWIGST